MHDGQGWNQKTLATNCQEVQLQFVHVDRCISHKLFLIDFPNHKKKYFLARTKLELDPNNAYGN
uniref:Uncharacterized protein n=1 Tax=Meloidogyne incognita TaxID=6306 RepID=A0A914MYX8_MELIC